MYTKKTLSKERSVRRLNYETSHFVLEKNGKYININLKELQKKLDALVLTLQEVKFANTTTEHLRGLKSHLEKGLELSAKRLKFKIEDEITDEFLAELIQTLKIISQKSKKIEEITLSANLSETQIQGLFALIEKNNIGVFINLPAQFSSYQKIFDETVSQAKTKCRAKSLTENAPAKAVDPNLPKRYRTVQSAADSINVDIDVMQEVEINVSHMMGEAEKTKDDRNTYYYQAWTFKDFIANFDKIPLNPGAGLLNFKEKQACWKSWVGDFHTMKVSREAVIYLLNNRHLQPGLHIHHARFLPKGLALKDYPPTLDYSVIYSTKQYRLAPTIAEVVQEPLSYELTKQIIEKLEYNHPVKKIYQRLEAETDYNREHWKLFQTHLPTLLLLDAQILGHYYNGGASLAFLDYVLENQENIQKVAKPCDEFDLKAMVDVLTRDLTAIDSLGFLANISGIAEALMSKSESNCPHILKQLITDKALSQEITLWEKKLSFNDEQLNGLLRVYSEYGAVGLEKLFDYWKNLPPDELNLLCTTLFRKGHSFSPMLNPKFTQAINTLQTLRKREDGEALFQWWSQLLEQHCQIKGFDSLPALADSFVNFTRQIDKYGLTFYPNPQFSDTKCLPTTLASMLILLNDYKLGERKARWLEITALDLHPNRFKACQISYFSQTPEPQYVKQIPVFEDSTLPVEIIKRICNQPQSLQPYLYKILNQYNAKLEAESSLILLFNNLIDFQNRLTEQEMVQFLSTLSSEIFSNSMADNSFRLLLNELKKYENLEFFYYFMDRAALIPELDARDFATKAMIYLAKREYYDCLGLLISEPYKHLKPLDIIHLSSDYLLKCTDDLDDFWENIKKIIDRIELVVKQHPQLKEKMLMFIRHNFSPKLSKSLVQIMQMFLNLPDSTIVNFICNHFNNEPNKLTDLLNVFTELNKENRNLGLKIWYLLKSNNFPCDKKELTYLTSLIPAKKDLLQQIYGAKPPHPTLAKAIEWVENPSLNLKKTLEDFKLKPCDREARNGFDLEAAKKIQIPGISLEDKQRLHQEVIKARTLTAEEISQILQDARVKGTLSDETLIALAAELLHKIKGRKGNSYEINTTQYLEIFSMLRQGRIAGEIATGEGKSRIFAISIACSYARGKSPNFATSNKVLSYATYNEFKPYYEALARVVHIDENTSPEEYSDGQNFDVISISDTSGLQLFRNKAYVEDKAKHVMHPDPEKRALFLDEGDRVLYDLSDKRFNFSKKMESLGDNLWIYEQVICFFEDEPQAKNLEINECNQAFYDYCAKTLVGEFDKLDFLHGLSQGELELWLTSAYNALNRIYETNFLIEKTKEVQTSQGIKIRSETYPVLSAHGDKAAKMSFGEQQCLHVRANRLKNEISIPKPEEKELVEELAKCKHDFHVDAESRILYSSSSVSLLQDYPEESSLYILSGTIGSIPEQKEASIQNPGLKFITFPRHQESLRRDNKVKITDDREEKFRLLLEEIKFSIIKIQPVQIFLENGTESHAFYKWLQKNAPTVSATHITTDMPLEKIERHMKKTAGIPGHVTISTEMIGRGTHSVLHKESQKAGFKVLIAFLPAEERSLNQIKGRAARYGEKGETRIILDKKSLEKRMGKRFHENAFEKDPDFYLQIQQKILESKIQRERIVKDTVTLYRMDFTRYFYQCLSKETKAAKIEMLEHWAVFVRESDIAWNSSWSQLRAVLNKDPLDIARIELLLNDYSIKIQDLWQEQIEFPMDPFPELRLSQEKKDLLVPPKRVPSFQPTQKIEDKEPVEIPKPIKEIDNSFLLAVFGQLSTGEIVAYSIVALIVLASIAGLAISTLGVGAVASVSMAAILGLSVTGVAVAGAGIFATNTYTLFSSLKRALEAEPVEQKELKLA